MLEKKGKVFFLSVLGLLDAVARRFRAYTDGLAGPGVVLMGYDPTV